MAFEIIPYAAVAAADGTRRSLRLRHFQTMGYAHISAKEIFP